MNVIEELYDRGFIDRTTHEEELNQYIEGGEVTCYIGFDPTASSLHVGSLIPIMSLAHMQRHGHKPIALVGGGTGLVGDPSGKTEMRQMLTLQMVDENAQALKKQLSHYIKFSDNRALLVNNADWLTQLEYIPFLRDYGRHFSVNRMIKAESYKSRLDSDDGLSFIEFNYMVLQAYDFLELFKRHACRIQMGGSDQWGNIVAGIELTRRVMQETVFGVTFPLITTSSGAKMGKTAKGAVWLDPQRTSPYEYFQFWRNTDDPDVSRFMALFTFLPMDEIRKLENLTGSDLNAAKAVLAFEATKLAHGDEAAKKALSAAASNFGAIKISDRIMPSSSIPRRTQAEDDAVPQTEVEKNRAEEGIPAYIMFHELDLAASRSAARKLISQGGGYINGDRIGAFDQLITLSDFKDGEVLLRAGKKRFHKVRVQD